ncbi:MAG: cytochrome c-type biogenesis protein CcmH [Caldilineaceae bacterium]
MRKSLPIGQLLQPLLLFVLILLFASLGTSILWAQDATPATVTPDQVNTIARELWCPLCSGVRLDACELKACEQMKEMIAVKLGQGEDLDSIRSYFVDQYGPQVLGEPPREGFSWLAWILPFAVLIVAGFLLWSRMRLMVRPAAQGAADGASANHELGVSEEEAAKLREELKRYG